ncbi:MAG: SDR family oxidoreductase, partial [Mycobacterium sp.]
AEAIVCDNTDPASLVEARGLFPHHLDTIVNVPAPCWETGDPRTYSLTDLAAAWRNTLDAKVLSAVLTVQTVGDHLRSGGSIISVVPENPRAGSADAAVKAALSDWTAGQATVFGTRGITVNVVASGSGTSPGYDGLTWGRPLAGDTPPTVAAEVARLALFLTTPAARHITGQTLHVSHGALAQFG